MPLLVVPHRLIQFDLEHLIATSMKKTVVITQSNYVPWRGYFDMIRQADELIFLDNVQYTRRDWRNRNQIKTQRGSQWLTIPVEVKGKYLQSIDETRIADATWAEMHIRLIEENYRKASAFSETAPWLFDLMRMAASKPLLSVSNQFLIGAIAEKLEISTPMRSATDIFDRNEMDIDPSLRLVELCKVAGATRYLTGPAARNYMNEPLFEQNGIDIVWMDYDGYPQYPQCWGSFEPRVSIVDLLLNCGRESARYLLRP